MIGLRNRVVLLIGILVCAVSCIYAAPFAKKIEFVQPDGTQIELWGEGDEFYAVFETLDGYTVTFDDALRGYVYAVLSADGSQLVPTQLEVGKGDPQTLGLAKHLRISPEARAQQALERSRKWATDTGTIKRWTELKNTRLQTETLMEDGPVLMSPPASHTLGQKMGLTLLIDFENDPATITKDDIEQFCNGDAFTGYGNNGSVKKYFLDNSGGLLIYSNTVTAYIRIPNSLHPKSYYNDTTKDCGMQARILIQDAITIMKARSDYVSDILPTFADLTVNGANQAVAFNVYYAGGNGNRWMYGLWPHSWSLASPIELSVGGKSVYNYQITNIGDTLELGTFCHENGHMLCDYPDIYDYDYDSVGGAGGFCLMNSGGHGHNPVQICAYLKYASGWSETIELDYRSNLQATLVSTLGQDGFNRFYRYEKPGTPTEYFLFENRQKTGRDAGIAASGIAIWHIDEFGDKDIQSLAYNSYHYNYECTLVQADNLWHFQNNVNGGDANDLYYQGNTAEGYTNQFNDTSQPSARWWDGTKSRLKARDFSASGPVMTFNMVPPPPVMLATGALPPGRVGTAYTYTFGAAGAVPPYVWSLVVPTSLDALNLTLSSDGLLSGTPEIETNVVFDVVVSADNLTATTNTFSLTIRPVLGIPFTETFENGGLIADSWTQESVSNSLPWEFRAGSPNLAPSSAHGGAYNACLALTSSGLAITRLISPRIDFGDGVTSGQLTFWHYMSKFIGRQDELRVYYKTTLAGPWVLIDGAVYTNSVTSWTKRTLTLPTPSRTYYIAFEGTAKYGYGICIDDVEIVDPYVPLDITTASLLPTATTEVFYSEPLTAVGGITNEVTSYTFALVAGEPELSAAGFSLSASGVISGTPTTVGTNVFTVSVTDAANTTFSKTFTLMVDLPRANLYEENFENEGLMPYGWTQEYVTNQVPWTIAEGGKYGHPSGPVSGYHNVILWSGAWTNGAAFDQKTRLISPSINLGQSPSNVRLTFWHCMESWDGKQDELRVLYRKSASNAWAQVAAFTSNVPVWTAQTVMLPEPSSTYYIAFEGNAKFGYGICIDDVSISDAAAAPIILTPTPLPVGRILTPYSQALEAVGGKLDYAWAIVAGALPTGIDIDPVSGLISGTPTVGGTYSFSVRVMGSDGKSSVNVYSLRILDSMTIPFVEHFENGGVIPLGWTQYRVSSKVDWIFRAGSPSTRPATAYAGQYNACLYAANTAANQSMLVSPVLDFASATNNTQLTFWHMMKNNGFQDQLRVYYRTAQDGAWVLLVAYTSDVPVWTKRTIALPNPGSTYQLAFAGTAQYGDGVCIDEISVTGESPFTPYETWLRAKLTSGEISAGVNLGATDDFDSDGIINALEYAYGLDPTQADPTGLPYGGVRDNHLFMVYRESLAASDVVFLVEACTSLVEHVWSPVDVSEFSRATTNTCDTVTAIHSVPVSDAPQRFLRLKVTVP